MNARDQLRLAIASPLLQGLLSAGHETPVQYSAKIALKAADALLEALEADPSPEPEEPKPEPELENPWDGTPRSWGPRAE